MIRKAKSTVSQYLQFRNTYFPQYEKTAALKSKPPLKFYSTVTFVPPALRTEST